MKKIDLIKLIILVAIIIIGPILFFSTGVKDLSPIQIKDWFTSFGIFAGLIFILIYSVAPIFMVPGSLLTISSGILFGPLYGTIYVIIGATIGGTAAFLTSRYFGSAIQHKLEKMKFMHIGEMDAALEKHGFLYVIFLRLIPLFPYNALNYGLGLTKVHVRDFIIGTALGTIPGTFAYVYLGASIFAMNFNGILFSVLFVVLMLFLPAIIKKIKKVKKH